MSVSMDWKPERVVQAKIRDMNKNNYPDRLKNPQGRSMQRSRIKRQSNCIRSGTVNLGHPVIRRPPIRSICKSKTRNWGNSKLLGRIAVTGFNVPFPYIYHFPIFFCGAVPLAGHHSIHQIWACAYLFGTLILFYAQNFFYFWWQ